MRKLDKKYLGQPIYNCGLTLIEDMSELFGAQEAYNYTRETNDA